MPSKNSKLYNRREAFIAAIYIAPFLLLFLLFNLYPMVFGVILSFLDRNSIGKFFSNNFIGFQNYKNVLQNQTVRESFAHSIYFSTIYIVLIIAVALPVAIVFNKKFIGRKIVRTMFYMPYVTNMIAIGIVWKYILNPYNGPINQFLMKIGVSENNLPMWLTGLNSALFTTAVISVWIGITFQIIIFLAALQDIPEELYEATAIEGANKLQTFWFITLPMLTPTIYFVLTLTIIDAFKNFTIISALTNGGPGTATNVISYQIYTDAFVYMKFSYGAAEGVLLTLFILLITSIVRRGKDRWKY